jgi:hypothetical protein
MSDDWRLRVILDGPGQAAELADELQRGHLEHGLASGGGDRVIVSRDDAEVFLYSDSRDQLERAKQAIETLAGARGWRSQAELRRWHPTAEEWEDPDAPLPQDASGLAAEHSERIAREREESRRLGFAEWEVRIQCRSHQDTIDLAERLTAEGFQPLRRWRYLLVGAADEDTARQLADRLSAESPAGCSATVEGTLASVEADTPANPFAVFGGLGG